MIVGKDGEPSYHLVLVPGQADDVTFEAANEWAWLQGYMSKSKPADTPRAIPALRQPQGTVR